MDIRQLEEWVQSFSEKEEIFPGNWNDLPEQLREQLDSFAREEAEKRADEFVRRGWINIPDDLVSEKFISAMSEVWVLPVSQVVDLAETYIDNLPSPVGKEFERTLARLFRRREVDSFSELKLQLEEFNTPEFFKDIVDRLKIEPSELMNYSQLLKEFENEYDNYLLEAGEDAVEELLTHIDRNDNESYHIADMKDILSMRGAKGAVDALSTEEELGLEDANVQEIARIFKRFNLLMHRSDGLKVSPSHPNTEQDDHEEEIAEKSLSGSEISTPESETLEPEKISDDADQGSPTFSSDEVEERKSGFTFAEDDEEADQIEEPTDSEDASEETDVTDDDVGFDELLEDEEDDDPITTDDYEFDRFAPLRRGGLRDRLVQLMFHNNKDSIDIFLAKLSGSPDWDNAEKFIVRELEQQEIAPETIEARQIMLILKKCFHGELQNPQ
ncbi:hypothetical protein K8I28_02610 [bacterium]|nr:hypothetical protein [bacterium]